MKVRLHLIALVLGFVLVSCSQPTPTTLPTASPTPQPVDTLPPTPTLPADLSFLEQPPDTLRLMSYNINWDSIFPSGDSQNHELREFDRVDQFRRILAAIKPDVLCLQEINYVRPSEQLASLVGEVLGGEWFAAHERDTFIVSRFPIQVSGYELQTSGVVNNHQQAAALVDLPDADYAADLYLICSHFKSGGTNSDIYTRQDQADVIMAQIQDAVTPGDYLDLPQNTPFVIAGDFNIYASDPHNHLWTLLRGDIYDEAHFGHDFDPDWDQTALADAAPSHNAAGEEDYTWRDDSDRFPPGIFDRIFYTDSVLEIVNSFVLNTTLLDPAALEQAGLQPADVLLGGQPGIFDHLPLVVDFSLY